MQSFSGKLGDEVDMECGEVTQQCSSSRNMTTAVIKQNSQDGDKRADLSMAELMEALTQTHHQAQAQAPASSRRRVLAVPRGRRFVHADEVAGGQSENNSRSKTYHSRPRPRRLLDSYRPDKDIEMADSERGPREDRGYGGGGRGGYNNNNRKRRYRGEQQRSELYAVQSITKQDRTLTCCVINRGR